MASSRPGQQLSSDNCDDDEVSQGIVLSLGPEAITVGTHIKAGPTSRYTALLAVYLPYQRKRIGYMLEPTVY